MITTLLILLFNIVLECYSSTTTFTYINGNYTLTPKDYNYKPVIKFQLWGDNAVKYGGFFQLFNVFGSSGGFIEADIKTFGNTTFKMNTGSVISRKLDFYTLYDGNPSILTVESDTNIYLRAGGGRWLETNCLVNNRGNCFVAFGGINIINTSYSTSNDTNIINIKTNINGTSQLALNGGMIRVLF